MHNYTIGPTNWANKEVSVIYSPRGDAVTRIVTWTNAQITVSRKGDAYDKFCFQRNCLILYSYRHIAFFTIVYKQKLFLSFKPHQPYIVSFHINMFIIHKLSVSDECFIVMNETQTNNCHSSSAKESSFEIYLSVLRISNILTISFYCVYLVFISMRSGRKSKMLLSYFPRSWKYRTKFKVTAHATHYRNTYVGCPQSS